MSDYGMGKRQYGYRGAGYISHNTRWQYVYTGAGYIGLKDEEHNTRLLHIM